MKRKDFIKRSALATAGFGALRSRNSEHALVNGNDYPIELPSAPLICILVPAETICPFPSIPSGVAMYWRSAITDGNYTQTLKFIIQ